MGVLLALTLGGTACERSPSEDEPEIAHPAPDDPPQPAEARRGLWVLAEGAHRTLESAGKIAGLVESAKAHGYTDLFVQVYRADRSWFPSNHADDAPYRAMRDAMRSLGDEAGSDPLVDLVSRAHAEGIRVHAWVNALSLATNREAPLLRTVGPSAVLVDRKGRSLLDYPKHDVPYPDRESLQLGTPGLWLDPATPGVIEHLEAVIDDLIAAAPDLDGLHLDFIRHPMVLPLAPGSRFDTGLDFGYGREGVARFEAEHGPFARGDAWDAFRRDRVSEVVRRLGARLPGSWERSAAVIAYADRAYLTAMQDWRLWLEEGWIDFAVPMAYTRDDRLLRYLVHSLRGGVGGDRVWIGLGSWLFTNDLPRMILQAEIAREAQPAGVAIFSYDSLVSVPGTLSAVARAAAGSGP